jgi:hypothetical protein
MESFLQCSSLDYLKVSMESFLQCSSLNQEKNILGTTLY